MWFLCVVRPISAHTPISMNKKVIKNSLKVSTSNLYKYIYKHYVNNYMKNLTTNWGSLPGPDSPQRCPSVLLLGLKSIMHQILTVKSLIVCEYFKTKYNINIWFPWCGQTH